MIKYKTARFHAIEEAKQSFSHEITMARLLASESNYEKAAIYYRDAARKAKQSNAKSLTRELEALAEEMEIKDKEKWIEEHLGSAWYLVKD